MVDLKLLLNHWKNIFILFSIWCPVSPIVNGIGTQILTGLDFIHTTLHFPIFDLTPSFRCATCNKKINITNTFSCRCEKCFCPKHRHPELHYCTFDYKAEGKKQLEENNPVISVPKLPKIWWRYTQFKWIFKQNSLIR